MNLAKSEITLIGTVPRLVSLAAGLGCRAPILPISYLALSLGAKFKDTRVWDGVIERMQRHLAGWKGQFLSKGVS